MTVPTLYVACIDLWIRVRRVIGLVRGGHATLARHFDFTSRRPQSPLDRFERILTAGAIVPASLNSS